MTIKEQLHLMTIKRDVLQNDNEIKQRRIENLDKELSELKEDYTIKMQALVNMAIHLTDDNLPPSIKIAKAMEEYIGAIMTVKKG